MEAKSATALPPVSAATTSDPHQRRSSVAAAAALIWKAKAAKHYRTHGHLIKLRRAGIDAAGPLAHLLISREAKHQLHSMLKFIRHKELKEAENSLSLYVTAADMLESGIYAGRSRIGATHLKTRPSIHPPC